MTLAEAFNMALAIFQDHGSLLSWLLVLGMSFVEFSKIKINPWSFLFRGIGKLTTRDVSDKITVLTEQLEKGNEAHMLENQKLIATINQIQIDLDTHIQESVEKDMRDRRIAILNYANAIINGRNHLKEEYEYMIGECDKYEMDCQKKGIINSVAEESIRIIKESYAEKTRNNSFLVRSGE